MQAALLGKEGGKPGWARDAQNTVARVQAGRLLGHTCCYSAPRFPHENPQVLGLWELSYPPKSSSSSPSSLPETLRGQESHLPRVHGALPLIPRGSFGFITWSPFSPSRTSHSFSTLILQKASATKDGHGCEVLTASLTHGMPQGSPRALSGHWMSTVTSFLWWER